MIRNRLRTSSTFFYFYTCQPQCSDPDIFRFYSVLSWQWCHNERDGISNGRRLDCLLNRLFRCRSKKTSKLRVTGLCEGNSLVTGEFPTQRTSNAENISIWWRHHDVMLMSTERMKRSQKLLMNCGQFCDTISASRRQSRYKMSSFLNMDPLYKAKTVVKLLYLYHGELYT